MSTVTYNHAWGAPFVIGLTGDRGEGEKVPTVRFWTARQECPRCGTQRNPITEKITKYRGSKHPETGLHPCQVTTKGKPPEWTHVLERVEQDLRALERDGQRVWYQHPDSDENNDIFQGRPG